jgi:hypothetical protein
MATNSSPYGIQPISDQVGTPRTLRIPNGIASGLASNIFKFQPVFIAIATGTITPVTATTDKIFGIFAGVEYTPTGQRPVVSPFWPASSTYVAGQGDMFAYVWPAWIPGQRFSIQADGTVAQALLGSGFNFSNFGNGSTTTGLSTCTAAAAGVAAASQAQMALVEFLPGVSDAIGDAFTDLIVSIAYPQIVSGFQTSIG